jgi:hypothetical protein
MTSHPEKQARAEAMLGELAELGLMVARELAVRVRGCEDVEETVALAGAFDKTTRVVRLTLALDAKLVRDAARDAAAEAEDAAEAARAAEPRAAVAPRRTNPIEARKRRVGNLLNRLLWRECEGDSEEYEVLFDDLNARLDEAALCPDFETLPIETLVRRVIADMGLTSPFALSLGEAHPPSAAAPAREPQPADTG